MKSTTRIMATASNSGPNHPPAPRPANRSAPPNFLISQSLTHTQGNSYLRKKPRLLLLLAGRYKFNVSPHELPGCLPSTDYASPVLILAQMHANWMKYAEFWKTLSDFTSDNDWNIDRQDVLGNSNFPIAKRYQTGTEDPRSRVIWHLLLPKV